MENQIKSNQIKSNLGWGKLALMASVFVPNLLCAATRNPRDSFIITPEQVTADDISQGRSWGTQLAYKLDLMTSKSTITQTNTLVRALPTLQLTNQEKVELVKIALEQLNKAIADLWEVISSDRRVPVVGAPAPAPAPAPVPEENVPASEEQNREDIQIVQQFEMSANILKTALRTLESAPTSDASPSAAAE